MLATAGSLSAISALFGGPLVGGVLLVESGVGLGTALLPALLPGFVAAAVGYLIFVGLGDWGGLDTPGLVVPDLLLYEGTHLLDLFVAYRGRRGDRGDDRRDQPVGARWRATATAASMASFLIAGGFAVGPHRPGGGRPGHGLSGRARARRRSQRS